MSDRPSEQDWHRENGRTEGRSAGQLMKEITEDISTLIRKEIELAKQELGTSVATKAKGAAILAVVAVMGFFMLIFLLLALRDGLDSFLWTWVADLVTVGVLGIIALVAALIAKRKLATPITADMTKKTIKEDVEWAKTLGKQ
ncbi:MAG: phage holin family protein [Actinomycetota bacterium]|nr:phage holin family protein [Actinomycetota bacterium]